MTAVYRGSLRDDKSSVSEVGNGWHVTNEVPIGDNKK